MQKKKKIQSEYILPAIIFASMIWGIFAGFRILRYQWIMIFGSVVIFFAACMLFDHHKKSIYGMIVICAMFIILFHGQLLNGFRIINNKMALALNQSMDLGFYYYISVQMEHSRRDAALAVVCFLLVAGILLAFLRRHPLILFVMTGIMECMVFIIAPYSVSASFFLFLGSWMTYFVLRKGKRYFGRFLYVLCLLSLLPLYFYDQTTVPADTMIKRTVLVQIRKITQGDSYLAVGGLGNGDIGSVGEVSPTGEKLFNVYAPENEDLYLKSYVSGDYENGKWTSQTQDTLVYGGESAIGLPYLFPDLHMEDFIKYDPNYIKTEKDILFSEKRTLKIRYQKKQDSYLLFPYFCDTSQIEGNVAGDRMILRTTGQKEYNMMYYHDKNIKKIIQSVSKIDRGEIKKKAEGSIEQEYVKSMDAYGNYVKKTYLNIPKEIDECLKTMDYKADPNKSILKNIQEIRSYLKKNYEYTYRPGLALQGKDPIIYFLKDRKKGFCTQYASAAVFMFRSVKIPARYVEGYKIRADQWKLGRAQVTDYEAHAWVEIYLDQIGWIPIDVTGRNTGKETYINVEKETKQNNAIVPNRKQFVTNAKKIISFVVALFALWTLYLLTKMLQMKRNWKKMTNKQKVLHYEKKLEKYGENTEKSRKTADRVTYEIIEKAKFSELDIEDQEVVIVKRHYDLLKRKNKNVTKILSRLK